MTEHSKEQMVAVSGIDLDKLSFHRHGVDAQGCPVFSQHVSQANDHCCSGLKGKSCLPA